MKKSEIKYKIQQILNGYEPLDQEFLYLFFSNNHSEWDIKSMDMFSHFTIGKTPFNTKCFYLNRYDGSYIDISYIHALKVKPNNNRYNFNASCRNTIYSQIREFRAGRDGHVHHSDIEFNEIVNRFISMYDIDIDNVEYNKEDPFMLYFMDHNISDKFYNYHKDLAKLEMLSIEEHRKIHSKN